MAFLQGLREKLGKKAGEIKEDISKKIELARDERKADKYFEAVAKSEARKEARKARANAIVELAKEKEKIRFEKKQERLRGGSNFLDRFQSSSAMIQLRTPMNKKRTSLLSVGLTRDDNSKPRKPMRFI